MTLRRGALGLLLSVAVLLAGCRGDDPAALVAGAADALADAGTARFEMSVVAAGPAGDQFRAEGAQDLATGGLEMRIDLGDDGPTTKTLLLGSDVFVRSPLFELFTGDPTTWVRVDLSEAAADQGLDADLLLEGNTGPAALLAQLDGASGDLERLGAEDVRGVTTTHLRATIDTDAAIEQAPPETREQLRAYAAATGLPATYPMELWIDEDGLVRRLRTVLDVPLGPGGPGDEGDAGGREDAITQETVLELFDFGVSVDLRAPDPAETVDLTDLMAELAALEDPDG